MGEDWVRERAAHRRAKIACSVDGVFGELVEQVTHDIKEVMRELPAVYFEPLQNNDRLDVLAQRGTVAQFFIGGDNRDRILGQGGNSGFREASVEFDDASGLCWLVLDDEHLTVADFSELVLGPVFFP